MNDKNKKEFNIFETIKHLLIIRQAQKAFHPNASRTNINLGKNFFCIKRLSLDKKQTIICLTNLTSKLQNTKIDKRYSNWKNLINPSSKFENKNTVTLKPFETIWLANT